MHITKYDNCKEMLFSYFSSPMSSFVGRDGIVGIATRYGLDGPGIEADPDGHAV
jgi:hypothetical protein